MKPRLLSCVLELGLVVTGRGACSRKHLEDAEQHDEVEDARGPTGRRPDTEAPMTPVTECSCEPSSSTWPGQGLDADGEQEGQREHDRRVAEGEPEPDRQRLAAAARGRRGRPAACGWCCRPRRCGRRRRRAAARRCRRARRRRRRRPVAAAEREVLAARPRRTGRRSRPRAAATMKAAMPASEARSDRSSEAPKAFHRLDRAASTGACTLTRTSVLGAGTAADRNRGRELVANRSQLGAPGARPWHLPLRGGTGAGPSADRPRGRSRGGGHRGRGRPCRQEGGNRAVSVVLDVAVPGAPLPEGPGGALQRARARITRSGSWRRWVAGVLAFNIALGMGISVVALHHQADARARADALFAELDAAASAREALLLQARRRHPGARGGARRRRPPVRHRRHPGGRRRRRRRRDDGRPGRRRGGRRPPRGRSPPWSRRHRRGVPRGSRAAGRGRRAAARRPRRRRRRPPRRATAPRAGWRTSRRSS